MRTILIIALIIVVIYLFYKTSNPTIVVATPKIYAGGTPNLTVIPNSGASTPNTSGSQFATN